ncbi:MAG: hypothetical protein WBG51_20490, partial [Syntrophobacteria bacterium]
ACPACPGRACPELLVLSLSKGSKGPGEPACPEPVEGSKGRRVAAIYILQQMTAKRTDPMTPKANDTEFNENEAL